MIPTPYAVFRYEGTGEWMVWCIIPDVDPTYPVSYGLVLVNDNGPWKTEDAIPMVGTV